MRRGDVPAVAHMNDPAGRCARGPMAYSAISIHGSQHMLAFFILPEILVRYHRSSCAALFAVLVRDSCDVIISPSALFVIIMIGHRSEEHTSELQSLMRISYAVFCLKKNTIKHKILKQHIE